METKTAECVAEVIIKPNHVNELVEYLIEGAVSDATWKKRYAFIPGGST